MVPPKSSRRPCVSSLLMRLRSVGLALLLGLAPGGFARAQVSGTGSLINQKIDLNTSKLPPPAGVTFWLGRIAYHNAVVQRASTDGARVSLSTSEGPLDLEWATLSVEAKGRLAGQYSAAVAAANAEAERAIAEQKAASEAAAGILTYRGVRVVQVLEDSLVLTLPDSDARFVLKGHPDLGKIADDDILSFKARPDGLYKNLGATFHAFQYVGPAPTEGP